MVSVESTVETIGSWITDRPRTVVTLFLVLTLVFAGGLGNISTDSGTSQFIEGNPAQEAFEKVNTEFQANPFADDTGSTQIIQRSDNVLAKESLLRSLTLQERVERRPSLRVSRTSSAAAIVAQNLDPNATTTESQQRAIQSATPAQIEDAVKRAADQPGFTSLLSTDFNRKAAEASATISSVQHSIPDGVSSSAGAGGETPLASIQSTTNHIAENTNGDFTVFGSGIISDELSSVIGDSMAIVVPAAVVLIVVFLVIAYRDPIDLLLGVISLLMAVVWTFGFMGLAGIPFSQMLIAVPVLLLAVGIDFGIHAVNRYREERVTGASIHDSMRVTTSQLLVAFFIVTGTTVIGFSANLVSDLGPIRDLGAVSGIGIVFTFLIFGVFLPSLKVLLDDLRKKYEIPEFGSKALGSGDSLLGRSLTVGNWFAKRAPKLFLAVLLITGAVAGAYGTGVDTSFSNEDFLPPEENPDYVEQLPGPLAPSEYTVTGTLNFLEDNFETAQSGSVSIYIEAPLREDSTLQEIHRANQDPPDAFVTQERTAKPESIITVIKSRAEQDKKFRQLVSRNDKTGDGIPDDNLGQIYDYLLSSSSRSQALSYITEDYRATRVVFSMEGDATQDEVTAAGKELATRYRMSSIATSQTIVFSAVSDVIFESAVVSLVLALIATAIFLVVIYSVLERRPSLGIVNLMPILWTIAMLAGTMRYLDIPLNVLTATVLSIAIGLGIDYSAHLVHRFADEYDPQRDIHDALEDTVKGTGGALAGSMLTTSSGTGVLALAITPILGQFGLVIALSVFLSFVASILVTPPTAVLWEQLFVDRQQH